MDFDLLVFIGRFRPFTLAHLHVVKEALKVSERLLIIVGSCFAPRSPRNPWTYEEVVRMIGASVAPEEAERIDVMPIMDYLYADHLWVRRVQELAGVFATSSKKVGLIGHSKDSTSYYLRMFPMWHSINVDNYKGINATNARNIYFSNAIEAWLSAASDILPEGALNFLKNWAKTPEFEEMRIDTETVMDYRKEYPNDPYVTADSIAIQAGHVLLIKRSKRPGKGLWALPGGFIDRNETLLAAAVRELREETNIDIPKGAIEGSLVSACLFDSPNRDPRARIITQAHLFNLNHELERRSKRKGSESPLCLTKINAASDAAHAEWVPLSSISSDNMYSDHFHIIQRMVGLL